MKKLPTVHRIHLKSAGTKIDPRDFCLNQKKILGVGYYVPNLEDTTDLHLYDEKASAHYKIQENGKHYNGWVRSRKAMGRVKRDDLVWTRDTNGLYYLGRVIGDWQYSGQEDHRLADICSFCKCEWKTIGTVDVVPGDVVNALIRGTAIRRVKDDLGTIASYSCNLWDEKSELDYYSHSKDVQFNKSSVWNLISHEDCEDVIGLYLQLKLGYAIIPGTCKASTAGYEFVLTHRETGEKAVVQVKQGSSTGLSVEKLEGLTLLGKVFLFSTQDLHDSDYQHDNITHLKVKDVEAFLYQERKVMPKRIQFWIDKTKS